MRNTSKVHLSELFLFSFNFDFFLYFHVHVTLPYCISSRIYYTLNCRISNFTLEICAIISFFLIITTAADFFLNFAFCIACIRSDLFEVTFLCDTPLILSLDLSFDAADACFVFMKINCHFGHFKTDTHNNSTLVSWRWHIFDYLWSRPILCRRCVSPHTCIFNFWKHISTNEWKSPRQSATHGAKTFKFWSFHIPSSTIQSRNICESNFPVNTHYPLRWRLGMRTFPIGKIEFLSVQLRFWEDE